jgi:transposase-like protein
MADNRLEPLVLSHDERRTLENWAKRRKTAQGLALRARIVLACADGGSNLAVAARLGLNRGTVTKWRARFLAWRLDGLGDEPRPGVPRTITDTEDFKISPDPLLIEKIRDVAGLYLAPPVNSACSRPSRRRTIIVLFAHGSCGRRRGGTCQAAPASHPWRPS